MADDSENRLFEAIEKEDKELVQEILQTQKIDINCKDKVGDSLLHCAVWGGSEEIVKNLVRHGPEINLQNDDGDTPLDFAANNGFKEIVNFLVEQGAKIDIQNNEGWTPLHSAVTNFHKDVVEILVECGANVDIQNKDGNTVFDMTDDEEILELLNKLMGKYIKPARK